MPLIEASRLTFRYSGANTPAVSDVSFCLEKGEVLGLIGSNGAGKTTLLSLLNGMLQPTGGSLTVCGINAADRNSISRLWNRTGVVFQSPEKQLFEETVYKEIEFGLKNMCIPAADIPDRIRKACAAVGLDFSLLRDLPPLALSGGMRRRLAIACILAMEPPVLALDEPTAGLDDAGTQQILKIVAGLKEDGTHSIIISSHRLDEILPFCTKLAVLRNGILIAYGDCQPVLSEEAVLSECWDMYPEYIKLGKKMFGRVFHSMDDFLSCLINNLGEAP